MTGQRAAGPWYGFLYRALGAHGTFWLWVVSIGAVWWTWQGAVVRLLDRDPEHRTVIEVSQASDLHRWVSLYGVELHLDGALLARRDPDTPEVSLLVDASDPAARFWHRAAIYAAVDAGLRAPGLEATAAGLGDLAGAAPAALRAHARALDVHVKLSEWREALERDPHACLPRPRGAIVLLRGLGEPAAPAASSLPVSSPAPAPSPAPRPGEGDGGDALEAYDRAVRDWGEAVRARVRLSFPAGLLDATPPSILERLEKDPGVRLGEQALQVDRRPRDAELYIFCAALLFMVFLAAGLHGIGRRPESATVTDA